MNGLVYWPNPILKEVSEPANLLEAKVFLPYMWEIVEKHNGVGLAAVQIGVPIRLFVMDSRNPWKTRYAFMNPELIEVFDEPALIDEGCLSVPGYYEKVMRYPEVVIRATNIETETEPRLFVLHGLEAQIAQHELEHLDGKMAMVDGAGPVKRDIIKRKIKKYLNSKK